MGQIEELDEVKTKVAKKSHEGEEIASGSEGTVILVHEKPELAFEIEFHLPGKDPEWQTAVFDANKVELVKKFSRDKEQNYNHVAIMLTKPVPTDAGQPVHPYTLPAGIYGQLSSFEKPDKYYVRFTLPTTSIYGYNWVYATLPRDAFEFAEAKKAEARQDIPAIKVIDS